MSQVLDNDIKYLKGVGPKRAMLFNKLGIKSVRELIYHLPRDYTDFSAAVPISEAVPETYCSVEAMVVSKEKPAMIRKGMTIYKILVTDGASDMIVTIFNSQYLFESLNIGESYILYGKITGNLLKKEMSSPLVLPSGSEDKLQPIYPLTAGLSQQVLRKCLKNAIALISPEDVEMLPRDLLLSSGFLSEAEALRLIHFPKTRDDIERSRKRLAFDELLTLRLGMMELKDRSRRMTTFSMTDTDISPFLSALPFKLTGAQERAISDCSEDMKRNTPMNRLILGDVGSGKTAVAAACCFIAAKNNAQAVMMAPTEILASQHYESLNKFLEPSGLKTGLLVGSMSKKQKAAVYDRCASGELDVIVGTHALFQDSAEYKRLGLVITDEQHRFGVEQRTSLAKKGENPHRLVMSATPIPRTLALMIYGELDISILDELPAGRKKISTYAVKERMRERAYMYAKRFIDDGGQAYVVCPAVEEGINDVKNVTDYAEELKCGYFSGYRLGILHGQMNAASKDRVMAQFKNHELDVLVCTTVIEVGVDVPNASVMIVENADRFGLSQLHQLRGRVGRGERESVCILIASGATEECRKRMQVISSTSSGFEIAEADLAIRGPGDFFGYAQHGLPPIKVADIAADSELIKTSEKFAIELKDRLFEPECTVLRRRVYSLFISGESMA